MATEAELRERAVMVQEGDLALRRQQFDYEKTKGPLNNAAVAVTMIAGLSAVLFQAGAFFTARQQALAAQDNLSAARLQSGKDWSFRGLELFVHDEDKLISCDGPATDAQMSLFTGLFPDLVVQFRNAAQAKTQSCITVQGNAAAAAAVASKASPKEVAEAADAARYSALASFAPSAAQASGAPAAKVSALPTVYIQIGSETQRSQALALQQSLAAKGYGAPGVQRVAAAPRMAQLRYYHPDPADVAVASKTATAIGSLLRTPAPAIVPVPGHYRNLPTGIVEYWFPAVSSDAAAP